MTYEIVDMDGGDVLAVYDDLDAATHRGRLLVEEHPELADDIAVVPINRSGQRAGDIVWIAPLAHAV